MTAELEGGEWSAIYPRESPGTRLCGPQGRSGLVENFVPTGYEIFPDRSARSSVAIPTELPHTLQVSSANFAG